MNTKTEKIRLTGWSYNGSDKVNLVYSDGAVLTVERKDFNRAFGTILRLDKDSVINDYVKKNFQPQNS